MVLTHKNTPIYIKKAKSTGNIGRNVIAFPEDYTVIDLETTGLNPLNELIIEFAGVKVKGGEVVGTFQNLCNPGFVIPHAIEQLTGITTDMVADAPAPLDVLPYFLEFVGDDFVVGHNVNFDMRFVAASVEFFKNDYIDTMAIFRKLHPKLPHHRLCDMVEFYGKENTSAHRALSDCIATNACYRAMKKEIELSFGSTEQFINNLK